MDWSFAFEGARHLPVYATMLVLLVYGSDARLRRAVCALWPCGRLHQRALR